MNRSDAIKARIYDMVKDGEPVIKINRFAARWSERFKRKGRHYKTNFKFYTNQSYISLEYQ